MNKEKIIEELMKQREGLIKSIKDSEVCGNKCASRIEVLSITDKLLLKIIDESSDNFDENS
jgi:hypothetical protein